MEERTTSIGILFNRKSGKVVKAISGYTSMLRLFAMNNVSASRDYVILNRKGICEGYFEGKKNDLPTICDDMIGKSYKEFNVSYEQLKELFA